MILEMIFLFTNIQIDKKSNERHSSNLKYLNVFMTSNCKEDIKPFREYDLSERLAEVICLLKIKKSCQSLDKQNKTNTKKIKAAPAA